MEKFLVNSKAFIRNPLGVIALFISLMYAMASFVISKGLPVLEDHEERMWLIVFVVLYPVLLLIAFLVLVIWLPLHLYSPSDFKDENLFWEYLTKKQKDKKLRKEVKEANSLEKDNKNEVASSLSNEVNSTKVTVESLQEIEREALLSLRDKFNLTFVQDVAIGRGAEKLYCDGYVKSDGTDYIVEIKYMPNISRSRFDVIYRTVRKIKFVLDRTSVQYKIVVCVVYSQKENNAEVDLKERLISISPNCELVMIDKKYLNLHTM